MAYGLGVTDVRNCPNGMITSKGLQGGKMGGLGTTVSEGFDFNSLLTGGVDIGGMQIPYWGIGAAGLVLVFMMGSSGGE